MLKPAMIHLSPERPSTKLKRWHVFALISALAAFSALFILVESLAFYDYEVHKEKVYVPELKAEVLVRTTTTYAGGFAEPERIDKDVRVCLYDRNFDCDDRWVPYDTIDVVAKRNPRRGEAFVRGCIYLEHNETCLCEPHDFLLPLNRLR